MTPLLKSHGFRKTNATWRKEQDESIAVFNVQKSQWDNDDFYLNVGLYFRAIGNENTPTENKCHIRKRLEHPDPGAIVEEAMQWFSSWGTFEEAKIKAKNAPENCFIAKELKYGKTT